MRVRFESAARDELDRIFAWIAKDNPRAALEMVARIEEKVMRLESPELENMGRRGLVQGTREVIEWPYIIVYRVDERRREVIVVSVVHGACGRERRELSIQFSLNVPCCKSLVIGSATEVLLKRACVVPNRCP